MQRIASAGRSRQFGVLAVAVGALLGAAPPVRAAVSFADLPLRAALERARVEKKWLLVDVYASWCGPCQEMDEKVYSQPDVGEALAAGYVVLRRDGERDEGVDIVRRHHVVGFPTLLVLDAQGHEVDRVMGFVESKELLATLAAFRAGTGTLAALEAKASHATDPTLFAELARRHAWRGDPRAVDETERVIAADPEDAAGRASAALFGLGKYYYLRGQKDYGRAAAALERLVARWPSSKAASEAPYHLAIARHGLGEDARAEKILDAWLAATPPADAERYNSYVWCAYKNGFATARAREVARRGLAAFPDADALWDSLAELEASTGHAAAALEAERRAAALKPSDRYYRSQVERFARAAAAGVKP